jgi:phospholipase/carboxylesterase
MPYLSCVEREPDRPATAAVIWLHGLGANGYDFEPIVPELRLPAELAVRFVFPHAPSIPVAINGGAVMPAWYDILETDLGRRVDTAQLVRSAAAVRALVDREIERGVASERIVVAGFSQGGAVGFELALTYPQPLAGLLALSTYFATSGSIEPHPANRALPIQMHHGTMDPIVPEAMARASRDALLRLGYPVEYTRYPMTHGVCLEEIVAIGRWLCERLD